MYISSRKGVSEGSRVHVRTGSRRREFEGERKSSERLLQARERLGLAHRGVVEQFDTNWKKQSRALVSRAPARLNRGRGSAGDFVKP